MLYLLRMSDGRSVRENLNAFNNMIIHLFSVDTKIIEEEKCSNLFCSFPNSWDSLVVIIVSNITTLMLEKSIPYMLLEEMRSKNMEGFTKDALVVRHQRQHR
jgi:hypothetical protein